MEEALRAMLIAADASPALIGERVYPIVLPQGYNPANGAALTYQVISGPRGYVQEGQFLPTIFRVQLDIWAATYEQTRQVRDVIVPAISAQKYTASAVKINRVFIDNERDLYESSLDQSQPKLFRKSMDLFVTAEQD